MERWQSLVIANAGGQSTIPPVVAYTKGGDRLLWSVRFADANRWWTRKIRFVKRFIDRKYDGVTQELREVSYKFLRDSNASLKLDSPAAGKHFAPEENSAQVLRKLADDSSKYLCEKVTQAVVTVPACFNSWRTVKPS